MGFHFFCPLPYDNPVNLCGGVNKKFDSDQKVYVLKTAYQFKGEIKVGIPCK